MVVTFSAGDILVISGVFQLDTSLLYAAYDHIQPLLQCRCKTNPIFRVVCQDGLHGILVVVFLRILSCVNGFLVSQVAIVPAVGSGDASPGQCAEGILDHILEGFCQCEYPACCFEVGHIAI